MFKIKLFFHKIYLKNRVTKTTIKTTQTVHASSATKILAKLFFKMIVLITVGSLILFPFYYMIATSLMSPDQFDDPTNDSINPNDGFHWANYTKAFEDGYWQALLYSGLITSLSIIFKIIVTMLMGYAFSLKNWRFKKTAWAFFLILMFLPEVSLLSGQYGIMIKLGLNQGWKMIVAMFLPFVASVFSSIMFWNAFVAIPDATKKSAMIDGVSDFGYFIKIAVPMVMPTTITVAILTGFSSWNSYLWPSLLLLLNTDADFTTIPIWVFETGTVSNSLENRLLVPVRIAGTAIAILPMFIAFFVMRRKIMNSVSRQGSAIKG